MKEALSSVLAVKGNVVHSVAPTLSVAEAVRQMVDKRIGSVLVMEGEALVGIFTERDALTRVLHAGRDPRSTAVHEVMTHKPFVAPTTMTVEEAMANMTERRLRRIPIAREGRIVGLISIGDLTKWAIRENEQLVHYISGDYPA
jgi:CBS domain-containing protein